MKKTTTFKKIILAYLCFIVPSLILGQKLPKLQNTSLRAPDNIRIDGLATEWGYKFQAYNSASRIGYTLSNTDDIIYLTINTTDSHAISKIINSGITFIINKSINITFPVLDKSAKGILLTEVINRKSSNTDSLIKVANEHMSTFSKIIDVKGLQSITESELSVYNTDNIKVATAFNNNRGFSYTYELYLPIKYLNLQTPKFSYDIKLNAPPMNPNVNEVMFSNPDDNYLYERTTTDLHGEYTLAKK